ncbi:hypothetical protein [Shewanella frigidimarina]|uniref:hypothetical protein n=1 Tax=Shewanella frigidimarina TaxID=56812 RepID=UPI003D7C0138
MRGWIGLAIIAGIIYYFATETDKIDKPINDIKTMFTKADKKLDSMTGTKITKIDKHIPQIKTEIYERLSTIEIRELDGVFTSNEAVSEFKTIVVLATLFLLKTICNLFAIKSNNSRSLTILW